VSSVTIIMDYSSALKHAMLEDNYMGNISLSLHSISSCNCLQKYICLISVLARFVLFIL